MANEGATAFTVRAIVERANISRSAFYSHYSGLPDLARVLMMEAFQDLADREEELNEEDRSRTLRNSLQAVLAHFADRRPLYAAALALPGAADVQRAAVAQISGVVSRHLSGLSTVPAGISRQATARWLASAHYGIYDAWMRGDLDVTADTLAETMFTLLPEWYRASDTAGPAEHI